MAVLIGTWTMSSPQFPDFRGRATFRWIEEGAYLAVRDEVESGDFPSGSWIIGGDDSMQDCAALYHDSRGVRRVYQTNLADGVWRIWRNAPEFNQRFVGQLSDGGETITARWERSDGESDWMTDFDLMYRRIA
jgi:hypothetical protein